MEKLECFEWKKLRRIMVDNFRVVLSSRVLLPVIWCGVTTSSGVMKNCMMKGMVL